MLSYIYISLYCFYKISNMKLERNLSLDPLILNTIHLPALIQSILTQLQCNKQMDLTEYIVHHTKFLCLKGQTFNRVWFPLLVSVTEKIKHEKAFCWKFAWTVCKKRKKNRKVWPDNAGFEWRDKAKYSSNVWRSKQKQTNNKMKY